MLTNVDEVGRSYEALLPTKADKSGDLKRAVSVELVPTKIQQGEIELLDFCITEHKESDYASLELYCNGVIKPLIAQLDYKEQALVVTTADAQYHYDADKESLIKTPVHEGAAAEALGCGKIVVKATYKKATKTASERIVISVELMPDYQKDYEIIPYHADPAANLAAIAEFMARYISKPFRYAPEENVVGVELNFNKIFYKPETLRPVRDIVANLAALDAELNALEAAFKL
jgi:type I restriction enzyme M protein